MIHSAPILVYHKVGDRFELGITTTTVGQFHHQMTYLHQMGYRTLTIGEWFDCLANGQFPEKSLAITFDDGYESIYYQAFPVMQRYGFSSTVFVVTGFVGKENRWDVNLLGRRFKHLSWGQMRKMASFGHSFQSHTVNHPDLTKLTSSQLRYELSHSREVLQEGMGEAVEFLAYPFGKGNPFIDEVAGEVGYKGLFGQTNKRGDNCFGREGVYLIDSLWDLRQKLGEGWFLWGERMKGRIINFFSWGTPLVKRFPDYNRLKL